MTVLTAGYLLLVALIAGTCFAEKSYQRSSSLLEDERKESADDPWRYDSSPGPLRQWKNLVLLPGTIAVSVVT